MVELIRIDIINGKRKSYHDGAGKVFENMEELENFRKEQQALYPDCEVCFVYKTKEQ